MEEKYKERTKLGNVMHTNSNCVKPEITFLQQAKQMLRGEDFSMAISHNMILVEPPHSEAVYL